MRTFALLLVFTMPMLVACNAADAKVSNDIGKPVCTHFDDSAKPVQRAGVDAAAAPAGAVGTPVATTATATTVGASQPAAQVKGGGTSSLARPHGAPRWQTFLPGMFK
jgi:hypothetical protein